MGLGRLVGASLVTAVAAGIGVVAEAVVIADKQRKIDQNDITVDALTDVIDKQQKEIDKLKKENQAFLNKINQGKVNLDKKDGVQKEETEGTNDYTSEDIDIQKEIEKVVDDASKAISGMMVEAHHMISQAMASDRARAVQTKVSSIYDKAKDSTIAKEALDMIKRAGEDIHKSLSELSDSVSKMQDKQTHGNTDKEENKDE